MNLYWGRLKGKRRLFGGKKMAWWRREKTFDDGAYLPIDPIDEVREKIKEATKSQYDIDLVMSSIKPIYYEVIKESWDCTEKRENKWYHRRIKKGLMRHNKSRDELKEKPIKSDELDGQTGIWVTIRDLYADERISGAPDHVVEERIARNKPRRKHVPREEFYVPNGSVYGMYKFRDTRNRGYSMYIVWDMKLNETDEFEARLATIDGGNAYLGIFGQKRTDQTQESGQG